MPTVSVTETISSISVGLVTETFSFMLAMSVMYSGLSVSLVSATVIISSVIGVLVFSVT